MLAKSKLNSIEPLLSQALIDMEISHEELITIIKEKDKYGKMKENVRNASEKQSGSWIIFVTDHFNWLKKYRKKQLKIIEHFMPSILFGMYKIYLISAEGYKNADVHFLRVRKTDNIWASIKNAKDGRGVKSMSDLILKELYDICETENLTEEQIKKYKMTEREVFEKYDNLTKDKLTTKSNKNVYVRNDNMTTVIKSCRGEKKKRRKKNRWIKKRTDDSRT